MVQLKRKKDPTCCREDPVESNKYIVNIYKIAVGMSFRPGRSFARESVEGETEISQGDNSHHMHACREPSTLGVSSVPPPSLPAPSP